MLPNGIHKVGQAMWLDVRESDTKFKVVTTETEEVRPVLLPYEERIVDIDILRITIKKIGKVIILKSDKSSLPKDITSNKNVYIRNFSSDRISRQVPRDVNIWIQWFPHKDTQRATEFNTAFENNVKCKEITRIYQLSEAEYDKEKYPFIYDEKVQIITHKKRISYNDFFKLVKTHGKKENPMDIHILVNGDMEWTREASLGLEYCMWEAQKTFISPLRWEDRNTLFSNRSDSQDVWGFQEGEIPDETKMRLNIPLGKPGCDNRILMEMLIQGYQTINHPLQFPTIHHHKTGIRDYTKKDKIPSPYLIVRPQWHLPLITDTSSWVYKASLNLRNRVCPIVPDSYVNHTIMNGIRDSVPLSIGKVGQIEAEAITMFNQRTLQEIQSFGIAQGQYPDRITTQIYENAGVFPNDKAGIDAFVRRYQCAMSSCNILSVSYPWLIPEWGEHNGHIRGSKQNQLACRIPATEPFFQDIPYSTAFANKKVVVVSPFVESFKKQLPNRHLIWGDRANEFLPETTEWRFVKSPLSAGIVPPIDTDWNDMIDRLVSECFPADKSQWPDIVLTGCGPGGLCICQEAKERGKIGISLGGGLQLLFGVRGKRWDASEEFRPLFNQHWIRPSGEERPPTSVKVERGCYW